MTTPNRRTRPNLITEQGSTKLSTATADEEEMLDVEDAAIMLGTFKESGVRYPRRLIAEKRIAYVKYGSKVRIPKSAIREHIKNNTVEPINLTYGRKAA